MLEFFSGFMTAYLLTWPGMLVFLFLIVWMDAAEWYWASLPVGVFFIWLGMRFFGIPMKDLGAICALYLVAGIFWSFAKYRIHLRKALQTAVDYNNKPSLKEYFLSSLSPKKMAWPIVVWILIWPISMISTSAEKFLYLLQTLVTKWLRSIYQHIYDQVMRDV